MRKLKPLEHDLTKFRVSTLQTIKLFRKAHAFIERREACLAVLEIDGTYEDGVFDTLFWILTGHQEPKISTYRDASKGE